MRIAYIFQTTDQLKAMIDRWHDAVNGGNPIEAAGVVSDPVVVLGPKGAGPISSGEFGDWVVRSGIRLAARSWHPISDRLMVVEQDAHWPESKAPARVATLFRVHGDKVSASLRLPDLQSALELAYICRELAATE